MTRDMIKTATKAEGKPGNFDMSFEELSYLLQEIKKGNSYEAIVTAFNYGFVMGNRATLKNNLKRL